MDLSTKEGLKETIWRCIGGNLFGKWVKGMKDCSRECELVQSILHPCVEPLKWNMLVLLMHANKNNSKHLLNLKGSLL
jgi:uncharacterized protein (DUF983 family)